MGEFIGFNTGAVFGFGLKTGAVFGCKGRRHSYVKCIPCGGDQHDTLVPQVVPDSLNSPYVCHIRILSSGSLGEITLRVRLSGTVHPTPRRGDP